MKKSKETGITLITLAIAVVILVIISSLLVYNAKTGIKLRNLDMMYNDIELLSDKVNSYYTKYGALPASIEYIEDIAFEPEPNDSTIYYVIDLNALEGISLNYGYGFKNITSEEDTLGNNDVYIINEDSHHIYYAKGIEMDGTVYYTNESDDEVVIIEGSYMANGNTYCKTLQEAVDSAEEGSTIKVIRGASETQETIINKNLTLDMNGKTIDSNSFITINGGIKVTIQGEGVLRTNLSGSFIRNEGELEINGPTIDGSGTGSISGTISNNGKLVINGGSISASGGTSILVIEGEIIINGGKINDTIKWSMNRTPLVTINNGEIDIIDATLGCDCIINGGKVNEILLGSSAGNINLTIGDKEQDVNYANPEIKSIRTTTGDLASITAIINFYNGIVKGEFNSSIIGIMTGEFNTRTGYTSKYDSTIDGTILVQN